MMNAKNLVAFISGLLFAFGLGLGGMTQPQNILAFLDITGNWNPALIYVMIGAILVHGVSYQFIKHRASPLLDSTFKMPTSKVIDRRLLMGAALFGMGWGLAGYCPGPGLASVFTGQKPTLVFVVSMLAGMFVFNFIEKVQSQTKP